MKKILIFLSLLTIIFIVGCQKTEPIVCKEPQIEKNLAIVNTQLLQWGFNENNPEQVIFKYNIYNYGDTEAQNISVKCKLQDSEGIIPLEVSSVIKENIASKTLKSSEIYVEHNNKISNDKSYYAYCYIESCEKCDILYKRIPNIITVFE